MISSSSFLIPLREKSSVHPPITSRSPQFGHLHGFFTAGGPKWRPRVNSAKSKLSLVFVRALSVARRPWSPWRANEHRLSQELSTGRRSFPLFARLDDRVTRREPVLSKKTIRNHPLPLVSAPFQLPLLSSTPLSLRTLRTHFVSPLPSLSSSPTHTHTHVQTAILRCFHSFTPLYSPCHSSISLCLHLSLPFDHQPRPLFLAHSLSFSRRRGTGTRYVILSMARRNMNASSVRSLVREEGSLSQHSAVIVITVMRISARALGCGGRSEGEWRRRRATPFDIDADESALPETSSEELVQNAATSERRS